MAVLVTAFKDTILAECAGMIRCMGVISDDHRDKTLVTVMDRLNETERLQLMFKLLDR